jgi:hypothetical protein
VRLIKQVIIIVLILIWQAKAFAQRLITVPQLANKNFTLSKLDFQNLDSIKSYRLQFLTDTTNITLLHPNYTLIGIAKQENKQKIFVYADKNDHGFGMIGSDHTSPIVLPDKKPLITVHGNIYYDVFYQSNIDTPFLERDIYQHTIRTYLDVTIKNQYPLRVNFSTRFSNSNMLRDITGLGFQFDVQKFKNEVQKRAEEYVLQKLSDNSKIDSLKSVLNKKIIDLNALRNFLQRPDLLQQLVEAREKAYAEKVRAAKDSAATKIANTANQTIQDTARKEASGKNNLKQEAIGYLQNRKDSLNSDSSLSKLKTNADTTLQKLENTYANNKRKYDSLKAEVDTLQLRYEKEIKLYERLKATALSDIAKAKNQEALKKELSSYAIPDTILPKGYKNLLAIKSVGIGRTLVDYSELSAKNITIKGLQVEYNPSYYIAIASGMIDYQFRDYSINTGNQQKQYLNILRIGQGMKDGNHLILTVFQGKKQLYNYYTTNSSPTINVPQPDYHIFGFTLEKRYQFDQNNYVSIEAGKSSVPYYRRAADKDGLVQSTFKFSDRYNEAYTAKFSSFLPATGTKISGMYKHTGADYQSFSYYTSNSTQNAWSLKVEQSFLQKKLTMTASLRKNDFSSPFTSNSYQSNTLFKSIQATMRIKQLPVVTVGYFPTSQLIKVNDDLYNENYYYTFTGVMSHSYRYKGVRMMTLLSYIRFYNKQPDSGFVFFNTQNILINHYIYFNRFTLGFTGAETKSTLYKLYTTGSNIQLKLKDWLQVGGGVKYNNQTIVNDEQWGYDLNATIKISKLGTFQFFAEKGFIPGINNQLVENKVGRFTYIKTF